MASPTSIYCLGIAISLSTLGFVSCKGDHRQPEKLSPSVRSWADRDLSHKLADLLDEIERGNMNAWDAFKAYETAGLDGESSEAFSTACGELARRDPTIFLRRHLMGDAMGSPVGKRAYGWIGTGGRHAMNWLHDSRLQLATDPEERRKIEEYISALRSVLESIDKEYQ